MSREAMQLALEAPSIDGELIAEAIRARGEK